jgi:hypothetical protein
MEKILQKRAVKKGFFNESDKISLSFANFVIDPQIYFDRIKVNSTFSVSFT